MDAVGIRLVVSFWNFAYFQLLLLLVFGKLPGYPPKIHGGKPLQKPWEKLGWDLVSRAFFGAAAFGRVFKLEGPNFFFFFEVESLSDVFVEGFSRMSRVQEVDGSMVIGLMGYSYNPNFKWDILGL